MLFCLCFEMGAMVRRDQQHFRAEVSFVFLENYEGEGVFYPLSALLSSL